MIKVEITDSNTSLIFSPHSIEIPDVRNMNENLQHEEQTCKISAIYEADLMSLLINQADLQAIVSDGDSVLFTGFVDNNTSYTDNGNPEPADIINITIRDRTKLFDVAAEAEVAQINKNLSQIVSVICQHCNVVNSASFPYNPEIEAFVLDRDKKYLEALSTLLFQYGYTWFFNESGEFEVLKINLQNVTSNIHDSDLMAGLNVSKTLKNYNAIKVVYGALTKKSNEQVFFSGNGVGSDNKVVPFTVRPGQYYPYESDPAQEEREGKIIQSFESGYAESYTSYSGEKKFRRATNQALIYTENHIVVQDWEGDLEINRTEFGARSAAVRLYNNGATDAKLKQFAIRADAYYRSANNTITIGIGKKEYSYEAEYIYDDTSASNLASLLSRLYTDTCLKLTGKVQRSLRPGAVCSVDTGLSGITCKAIVLNSQYEPESNLYSITLLSISDVEMHTRRYKERNSENGLTENLAMLEESLSKIQDGTANVGNPDLPTGILAVARKDDIYVTWTPPADNGLNNVIKQYIVEINKNDGDTWHRVTNVAPTAASYTFNRSIDYYPEAGTLAAWQVRITIENVYGKTATTEPQTININTYGTWIPVVPSLTKLPDESGITFEWPAPVGANSRTLYGSNQYELTVTYNGTDRPVITTSELNAVYTFDRDSQVDGYPEVIHDEEHTGLDLFSFKLKVINESGNFRQSNLQSFTSAETENYGTWIPVASSFTKRSAAEYGIDYEWTRACADGNVQLYGTNVYKLRVYCGNVLKATIEKGTLSAIYNFDRATDGYPEKQGVTGAAHTLDEYTATIEVINVSGNHATSLAAETDDSTYLGWKPKIPTITTRSSGRALTINPVNSEQRYGKIRYRYLINNLEKDGSNYYLPTPTADYLASEDNYKDGTRPNVPFVADSPYTQTVPLKGQNTTGYKLCSWEGAAAQDEYDEAEKKSITYSSTDPSTGQTTTTRTMNINGEEQTVKYWYDSINGIHYASLETPMPSVSDTPYRFKVQAFNSVADNIASAYSEPVSVTSKATAAFDVVNGAITANALAPDSVTTEKIAAGNITAEKIFVRALAAISANLGRITDGELVGNENNYWYLSDEYDDNHQLVHRAGDFRVGGATGSDYIKCTTQNGTTYNIEIHAKKFELTAVGTVIHGEFFVCDADQVLDANGRPTDYYAKITQSAIEMKKPVTISNNLSVSGSFSITDATKRENATNELIASLPSVVNTPADDDNLIYEYTAGRTVTTPSFYRTSFGRLWLYIKGKISSVLGLTASSYGGNAASADYTRQGAYCDTASATQAKVANMRGFSPIGGATFLITFTNSNSYNGTITLNINGTGAKNIWINGVVSSSSNKTLSAGTYICFFESGVYKIDTSWCVPYARRASTSSTSDRSSVVSGVYTGSGGQQNPQYVGKGNVRFNMMNMSINGDSTYKDFLLMDCYTGFDVGGATAFGISRTALKAFIMRSAAGTSPNRPTSWAESAELIHSGNIGSQSVSYAAQAGLASRAKVSQKVFGWCSTASGTQIKDISLNGFTDADLAAGTTIIFYLANNNTHSIPKLRVGGTGNAVKDIASSEIPFHKGLYGAYYESSGKWTIYPILNLSNSTSFNGTATAAGLGLYGAIGVRAWYFSASGGYIVFTNGLIIQWGHSTSTTFTLPISYTSTTSYTVVSQLNRVYVGYHYDTEVYRPSSANKLTKDNGGPEVHFITFGY